MKLLQYLKRPLPLRQRLILTIGLILLVFQLISTFWLWHESTEQIQLFEQALRENRNNDRHIMHEIREAIASLIENERLFTADVAHELRTPLSGVRLHLELLSKTHKVDVSPLIARLDQMMDSVSQLLQLARVGQSFSAGSYQHVKLLEDVILPSYDELSTMLDQRQQTLLLPQSAADVVVRGDATLLRMLLRNLVENAHRYSPEGTTITIGLNTEHDAVMAVEDEGPGIDESKCGELSKAFVRMDSRFGGIGLGLSIVSRITQLHHGHFYLQNRQGTSGTRAWVELAKAQ